MLCPLLVCMFAPTNPAARNLTSRKVGVGNKEMIAQGLQIPIALMEDLGLVPSTHLVAHNHMSLQFQRRAKWAPGTQVDRHIGRQKSHKNEINKPKKNLGRTWAVVGAEFSWRAPTLSDLSGKHKGLCQQQVACF